MATQLQAGESFANAFQGVDGPKRGGGGKLLAPGELFTRLGSAAIGAAAIALLRGAGGLDDWFADEDRMGGLDQFELQGCSSRPSVMLPSSPGNTSMSWSGRPES